MHVIIFFFFQDGKRSHYRQYSATDMIEAYNAVIKEKRPIRRAAKDFHVPKSSLRDRVLGLVPVDPKLGTSPLFTSEQESHLADHFKFAASNGYQYGRAEMVNIASEFAVYLGLRSRDNNLSNKWYTGFIQRWPDFQLGKPRMSTGRRTFSGFSKPAVQSIKKQEKELGQIIAKYNFKEKPERIYYVDDKMLYVPMARTPHVVIKTDEEQQDHRIISILGCGNAIGNHIPPYFIFSGDKMKTVCLKEKTPGTSGTKSEDGKLNEELFLTYLQEHFIKFIPQRSTDNPVLLLCDASKLYISADIIKWTEKENIIFLLIVSPDDEEISCFGTFDKIFQVECTKFIKGKSSRIITGNNVCRLACKSYLTALSAENLHRIFRQAGLYPFRPGIKSLKIKTLDFIIDNAGDNTTISEENVVTGESGMTSSQQDENADRNAIETNTSPQENILHENDGETASHSSTLVSPEHNNGMTMHIITQNNQTNKTLQNVTFSLEEVCQNVEAALSSKDEDSQSVNKNYISFFSNMEKVLLDNFKDGKAKKEKLSFMYCKEETDTLQHESDDGGPSVSKKSKKQNI